MNVSIDDQSQIDCDQVKRFKANKIQLIVKIFIKKLTV